MKTFTVLVVDDSLWDRELLVRGLRRLEPDVQILEASTGTAACAAVPTLPDGALVLLDHRLPGITALELLAEISIEDRRRLRFVLLSSVVHPVQAERAMALGVRRVIEKPTEPEGFPPILRDLLDLD